MPIFRGLEADPFSLDISSAKITIINLQLTDGDFLTVSPTESITA